MYMHPGVLGSEDYVHTEKYQDKEKLNVQG